jgi:uncharacterized protein YjgD (DUF1641 family)
MFISKAEKTEIQEAIDKADYAIDELIEIIKGLNERVGILEQVIKSYPKESIVRIEHKRAKQREYARRYYAKKKEAKQLQVVTGTKA